MQKLVNGEWVDCAQEDLVAGDIYRISVGGGWQQQAYQDPTPEPDSFTTSNEAVTINGDASVGFQSVYFGSNGDPVTMSFDLVDGQGVLQTQLDSTSLNYPPVLALPVIKVASGAIVDEVYFATTLVAGVISVTGSFPASGNWQMLTTRINSSLAEIGASWIIDKPDVTFRINS
jgi:hypothetical protein